MLTVHSDFCTASVTVRSVRPCCRAGVVLGQSRLPIGWAGSRRTSPRGSFFLGGGYVGSWHCPTVDSSRRGGHRRRLVRQVRYVAVDFKVPLLGRSPRQPVRPFHRALAWVPRRMAGMCRQRQMMGKRVRLTDHRKANLQMNPNTTEPDGRRARGRGGEQMADPSIYGAECGNLIAPRRCIGRHNPQNSTYTRF